MATNATGVCCPAMGSNQVRSTPAVSSWVRSHSPQGSSPAPPASAAAPPALMATLAVAPPKWGTKLSASARPPTRRSQIMSTRASPRQSVRMPVACPPVPLSERTEELDDGPVHWWEAGEGAPDPILWLHGVPNAGSMWRDFVARAGGVAVDAPGFGLTTKRADLDYSIDGYGAFVGRFLEHAGWMGAGLRGFPRVGGFARAFPHNEP